MIIYLLRHGIAEDRDAASVGSDAERQLTAKGVRRMEREATGLHLLGIEPGHIFTSPLIRAEQTARIVADEFDGEIDVTITDALAPGHGFGAPLDDQSPVVPLLRQPELESAMFVGHEPDFSQLASLLVTGTVSLNLELKKGGLCAIDVHDPMRSHQNRLLWLLTPKQLRAVRAKQS
jgi:phosphohistidine phosphatase